MSNVSTSKRALMALRDECDRLCLVARRHDERLRDVVQALERARWLGSLAACSRKWDPRNLHESAEVRPRLCKRRGHEGRARVP